MKPNELRDVRQPAPLRRRLAANGLDGATVCHLCGRTHCGTGLFTDVLGYFFITLWLAPFALAIVLVPWLRH